METENIRLLFGTEGADHVMICPTQRERPDSPDYHDRNWVTSEYAVVVHPWSGRYTGTLFADEISRFANDLNRLYETLQGTAEFAPMEPYVTMLVEGDGLGHFVVSGEATAEFGSDTSLSFSFTVDQTQIKETLKSLERFKKLFPHLYAVPS